MYNHKSSLIVLMAFGVAFSGCAMNGGQVFPGVTTTTKDYIAVQDFVEDHPRGYQFKKHGTVLSPLTENPDFRAYVAQDLELTSNGEFCGMMQKRPHLPIPQAKWAEPEYQCIQADRLSKIFYEKPRNLAAVAADDVKHIAVTGLILGIVGTAYILTGQWEPDWDGEDEKPAPRTLCAGAYAKARIEVKRNATETANAPEETEEN